MEARRGSLYEIVASMHPMTVRQVFYQATVRGLIEKTEAGYDKIQICLTNMRKEAELPYEWLADNSRRVLRWQSFGSVGEALEDAAKCYRKDLWRDQECRVQFWLEKDALAGVLEEVVYRYDVPLMIERGYSSLSFLHDAAMEINDLDVPVHVYHLGDFDPSGVDAGDNIEEQLQEMARANTVYFKRLAVLPGQITEWNLPTRPTKTSDSRSRNFGSDVSVELDAIEPDRLRSIVTEAIRRHMPDDTLAQLKAEEEQERKIIREFVSERPE
jgi:hypothetical protein